MMKLMTSSTTLVLLGACFMGATAQNSTETAILLTTSQSWGFGFLTGFGVSLIGFVAAVIVVGIRKCISENAFKILINLLYALGCGAMVGDSMIHILPEAYTNPITNPNYVSLVFICAIGFFLILERVFQACGIAHKHWGDDEHEHPDNGEGKNDRQVKNEHQHEHNHPNHEKCERLAEVPSDRPEDIMNQSIAKKNSKTVASKNLRSSRQIQIVKIESLTKFETSIGEQKKHAGEENIQNLKSQKYKQQESKLKQTESAEDDDDENKGCCQRLKGKGAAGYLNLLSSLLHNFFDGFAVGTGFASGDKAIFIPIIIAIFAHEIPREMGDVGILIKNGFSGIQTICCNFGINLISIAGVFAGLGLGSVSEAVQIYIMSFVAGNFIYIGADVWRNLIRNKSWIKNLSEVLSFSVGVGAMYLVLLAESGHSQ